MLYNPKWEQKNEVDAAAHNLLAAASYIEKHGHCKNELKDNHGRVCAIGAICETNVGAWKEAVHRLKSHIGGEPVSIWNNAPERTAAEVVKAMRDCAASHS